MMPDLERSNGQQNQVFFDGDNQGLQLGINYGHVNNHFYPPTSSSTSIFSLFTVPYPRDRNFIPRESNFDEIDDLIVDGVPVALCGLGGIGKSQIAIEYAYRFRDRYSDRHFVIWLYAESVQSLLWAFHNLAQKLHLPSRWEPKSDQCQAVVDWLEQAHLDGWLIILDSLDSSAVLNQPLHVVDSTESDTGSIHKTLKDYLPFARCSSTQVILVTTRSQDIAASLGDNNIVPVTAFSLEESRTLFKGKLNRSWRQDPPSDHEDSSTIDSLLDKLGHVPLAITQAAAFVKRNRVSPSQYSAMLEKDDHHLASHLYTELQDPRRQIGWPNSIFRTWKLSFDTIQHDDILAADLLSLAALLDGQAIPKSLLSEMTTAVVTDFTTSLGTLYRYALITQQADPDVIHVHPLVQASVRYWIREAKTAKEYVQRASEAVNNAVVSSWVKDRERSQILMSHVEKLLNIEEIEDCRCHSILLYSRARYKDARGLYTEAWVNAKQAFDLQLASLGKNALETLKTASMLGNIASHRGEYERAEKIHRRMLGIAKKTLGVDHHETSIVMGHLAGVLRHREKIAEAEDVCQRALIIAERVFGSEHADTSTIMNCLANIFGDQGKNSDAEAIYRRILAVRVKMQGPKHPGTLTAMSNLAVVLRAQGKNKEAEDIHRQTLATRETVLGLEHPSTSMSAWNLAYLLFMVDNSSTEARVLYARAAARFSEHLGSDHPLTQSCQHEYDNLLNNFQKENVLQHHHSSDRDLDSTDGRKKWSSSGTTRPRPSISYNKLDYPIRRSGLMEGNRWC